MSLVEPDTGELTVLLTKDEALALTAKIKSYAGVICQLVKEAHDKQAWRALGYGSWTAYTKAEFDISRSRSYQLIKYAEIAVGLAEVAQVPVEAITDALPEGSARNVTPNVIDEVSTAVDTLGPDAPLGDRLDAAMAKIQEAAPSPAVLAARARREREANEAAEPEQVPSPPAPVPDPVPHAPQAAAGLSDARDADVEGPAPSTSAPSDPDAVPPVSESGQPEPNQHSAPVAAPPGWDWDVVFSQSPEAAALHTLTEPVDRDTIDAALTWCHLFFQALKEKAA